MKGAFFSAALLAALVFPALSISCNLSGDTTGERVTDCPDDIAQRAFRFAELYETSGAEYEFGGQSPLRSVPMIDCSGLVVMCYKYALVDTQYFLLLDDMSAAYMYENASRLIPLEQARKGDLIFMGESGSSNISHIALFDEKKDGNISFIDSTEKEEEGINGVSRRSYPENDGRFKAFGVMLLQY